MIADRIRQARLAAGLTLGALGEQVGVSHTAIQKYEKGLLTPSSAQLQSPHPVRGRGQSKSSPAASCRRKAGRDIR